MAVGDHTLISQVPPIMHVFASPKAALVMLACATGIVTCPRAAASQLRASERGTIAQTVDGTRLTIDYSRPRLRGRWPVYGTSLVQWDEVWTPGADDATTLELSRDARLDGHLVKAGKYSVWLVVRKEGPWTFVLDPRANLFHTDHPDSTAAQLRFPVHARTSATRVETLTWTIDAIHRGGAAVSMAWGDRTVDLAWQVTPTHPTAVADSIARRYVGRYVYTWADTSNRTAPSTFTVEHVKGGALIGTWNPAQFGTLTQVMLVPLGVDRFAQGFMRDGELWAVYDESVFVFSRTSGRVDGFRWTRPNNSTTATAVKQP
ncbi:MAG: DUF2911 domain-containing protein [Gemmatimonadaceae bacterium]|jgi:hypothetical protein|nr:DUF2911 domain-containing protein [Gemmatimonadaceae bacterium]